MSGTRFALRERAKAASKQLFLAGERLGVHAMPIHYYSSVPSRRWLHSHEALWRKRSPLPLIEWNLEAQAAWLAETAGEFPSEVPLAGIFDRSERVGGFRYGPIEAQMLYSVIRRHAPRRVLEIGSGSTTMIITEAAQRNVAEARASSEITVVDPYAHPSLAEMPDVTVRKTDALELGPGDLTLEAGDLLFIDSTHTVRTGSEVPHLYINLLAFLPPGVLIHVHDIFLPYLYPPSIYAEYFDWQETTLVAALLANNDRLGVLTCMSALHHDAPTALAAAFPEYRPRTMVEGVSIDPTGGGHFPSSLWMHVLDG